MKSKTKAYLNINNGGISFDLQSQVLGKKDKETICPMLVIKATHFVTQTNEMKIPMSSRSLRNLISYLENELHILEQSKRYKQAESQEPLAGSELQIIDKKSKRKK